MIDIVGAIRRILGWTGPPLVFWSLPQEALTVPAAAADQALPDVTVAGIPTGATIVKVTPMFKFWGCSAVALTALTGAQEIQIRTDAPGAWTDAVNFADNQWTLAAGAEKGGDVIFGVINLNGTVIGNDTYNFQWDEAVADSALVFQVVQMGLMVWYR